MEIKNDNFVVNNTYRFVYPILRLYGNEYINHIKELYKQGVFIDDMFVARPDDREYLHIVINIPFTLQYKNRENLVSTLEWFTDSKLLQKKYILNVNKKTKKPHHIVLMLPIPQRYQGCISLFLEGNTNLFSKKDVEECFVSPNKRYESYFKYCRSVIAAKTKIKINIDEEVLNI